MQYKILIVDDDPAARYGLKRALAALGCEIVEAEDGVAALAAVAQGNPDLLICDIQMPKMDGLTLVKCLADQGDAPAGYCDYCVWVRADCRGGDEGGCVRLFEQALRCG